MARPPERGFVIEGTCPGCGSEVEIQNDFFLTKCQHCGLRLRLQLPDSPPSYYVRAKLDERNIRARLDRRLKESGQPLTSELPLFKTVYFPYWQLDAIVLKVRNRRETVYYNSYNEHAEPKATVRDETETTLTPQSFSIAAAEPAPGIPTTLGLRASTSVLHPMSAERMSDMNLCKVSRSVQDVNAELAKRASTLGSLIQADFGENKTELLHIEPFLVYFPYIIAEEYGSSVRRWVLDGVTGEIVDSGVKCPDESVIHEHSDMSEDFGSGILKLLPHHCEQCSAELPEIRSYLYHCGNCGLWSAVGSLASELALTWYESVGADIYFPFWVFEGSHKAERKKVSIPAFALRNPETRYRCARRMSLLSLLSKESRTVSDSATIAPLVLTQSQAERWLQIVLYRDSMTQGIRPTAPDFAIETSGLVYVPFVKEQYFYVDALTRAVTVEIGALAE